MASEVRPAAGLPGTELDRLILMPALGLAALVVILSATATFRVPLHEAVTPVGWLCALVFIAFCWRWHRSRAVRPLFGISLFAALAAWLAFADFAGTWHPDAADLLGLHPDSWSYQAFADYLDHYRRGQSDGMPMVDEFGAHLQGTRFAAPSLLAFLHDQPLLAAVPTARLIFGLMCLGTHFFSMLVLGRACVGYTGWLMPLLAAFLATAGGWFGRMLSVANNDNLIFCALAPALIGVCCAPDAVANPAGRWRVAAIALLCGAMFYNYPEGVALLGILCLPLVIALGWSGVDGRFRPRRWLEVGGGGVLGLLLAAPYLPTLAAFLHNQMTQGLVVGAAVRPGEGSMPGLLGGNRLAGAFALGDELTAAPVHPAGFLLPLCLLALMVPGAMLIARRQRWFPWVALPLLTLALWQNVAKHYDYGTYKVLLMANWWIYLSIGAGLLWVAERLALPTGGRVALAAVLALSVGFVKYENRSHLRPVVLGDRIKALQELSTLHFVTGQNPVLLALDDDFDYLWATFYLRGLPLGTRQQRSYLAMPHITPLLARGFQPSPESCPYWLVSGDRPDALWKNSRFSLVRALPISLDELRNPVNGLETVDGKRFLWIGTQPAIFQISARQAGRYLLSAQSFDFGPSMAGHALVHLAVTDAAGTREVEITPGMSSIPLTLAAGDNSVVLRALDTPEPGPHNGDGRELMLGILAPDVIPATNSGQ